MYTIQRVYSLHVALVSLFFKNRLYFTGESAWSSMYSCQTSAARENRSVCIYPEGF